jgi:hypothetical protein
MRDENVKRAEETTQPKANSRTFRLFRLTTGIYIQGKGKLREAERSIIANNATQ